MESCGIEKVRQDSPNAPPKPRGPPKVPCKEGICLMQHADLLLANQSVDYEKLRGFIDHWAESNPDFSEAILAAKEICAKDGGPAGPPVCEQDKIFFCLTSNILWNCKLRDLDGNSGCSILKAHMDECRPHFLKRKELEEQNGQ
nr:odorant binding protein [Athetis dissimilis]